MWKLYDRQLIVLLEVRRSVENFELTAEEINRQYRIGQAFLDLDLGTKRKHPCDFKTGRFFGFREGFRMIGDSGVKVSVAFSQVRWSLRRCH